jgi:hypothetical protein
MAPKEEELQKDEILVMKKEKKVNSLRNWIGYLFLGTIFPAISGLLLMRTVFFELPAASWEFMAVSCTMIYFVVFHFRKAEWGCSKSIERTIDFIITALMVISGGSWLLLTLTLDFITISLRPEWILYLRCVCGLLMMFLILVINILQWLRSKWLYSKGNFNNADDPQEMLDRRQEALKKQKVLDRRIRAHINVWILDVPSLFSLIVVFMGTRFILTTTFPVELFPETTHLAIASTFYSGAAAFHMLLGNAVFSFIHSGRLYKVIAPHSEVNSLQPEERAKR